MCDDMKKVPTYIRKDIPETLIWEANRESLNEIIEGICNVLSDQVSERQWYVLHIWESEQTSALRDCNCVCSNIENALR